MVLYNTTLVPSLGLRIGPACEAGLSTGMQRERVPPQIRKKGSREGGRKEGRKERRKEGRNKEKTKQETKKEDKDLYKYNGRIGHFVRSIKCSVGLLVVGA